MGHGDVLCIERQQNNMSTLLAVMIEVVPAHDGRIYCECGCGEEFPRTECVIHPTQSVFQPYEILSQGHAAELYGPEDCLSALRDRVTLITKGV